jgi:predicted metal-dependent phosphoesterase TrpH
VGKADLHIHTRVSDGLATIAQVLEYVVTRTDLDVIAVTDHEDARGGLRAQELAAKRGFRLDVIAGAEVTTQHGHLLALFVESTPRSFRSVESTLEAIHSLGGIAVVPHPMSWLTRSISERTLRRVMDRNEPGVVFDAIELANPSPAGRVTNQRARSLNRDVWRRPETGGSDAHHLPHIGTGWTEFDGSTAFELRASLANGSTTGEMSAYPSAREVGYGRLALGLAWGYAATPRKMLRMGRATR